MRSNLAPIGQEAAFARGAPREGPGTRPGPKGGVRTYGALQVMTTHSTPPAGGSGARSAVMTLRLAVYVLGAGPLYYPPGIPTRIPTPYHTRARTPSLLRYYRTRHTCCTAVSGMP